MLVASPHPHASFCMGHRKLVALNCRDMSTKMWLVIYMDGEMYEDSCNVTWIWHMSCDCGFKINHCVPWSSGDLTHLYSLSISCFTLSSDSALNIHHMASANQDKLWTIAVFAKLRVHIFSYFTLIHTLCFIISHTLFLFQRHFQVCCYTFRNWANFQVIKFWCPPSFQRNTKNNNIGKVS